MENQSEKKGKSKTLTIINILLLVIALTFAGLFIAHKTKTSKMEKRIAELEGKMKVSTEKEEVAGKDLTAMQWYDKAKELGKKHGIANRELNKLQIEYLTNALKLNPKMVEAYSDRGVVYQFSGLEDEAMADFDKAVSLDQNYYAAYNNRGNLFLAKELYDKAIDEFSKVISINPKFVDGYINRGNAYHMKGSSTNDMELYKKAIAEFEKAISINPEYALAYYNLGEIYFEIGKPKEARDNFLKCIDMAKEKDKVYGHLCKDYLAELMEKYKGFREL